MKPAEAEGLGELAGDAVADFVARIEEMHSGIAERAFAGAGVGAQPARVAHDAIARGVYAGVRTGLRAALHAGGRALALTRPPDAPSLEDRPQGRIAIGAVNGAFGSALRGRDDNPLVIGMTVRRRGRDVPLDGAGVRDAFADEATSRIAVFIHGLCETDDAWLLGSRRFAPYGERLRAEHGYTPVYVRYNSGRHISENGRELSEVLEKLVAAWPVRIGEIALIGHSMGGLIARSATHYGAGSEWTRLVRHVFALGTPHQGARLEQVVHRAGNALKRLPETRSLGTALDRRSHGIKDLRHGHLLDEHWDAEERLEVPFLQSAKHFFVSASLAPVHDSLSAKLLGDMLVHHASAWDHPGPGRRLRFPVDHYRHFGGLSHFALLNHPAVYAQISAWISGRPALPAAGQSASAA